MTVNPGTARITSDSALGRSGTPTRVYSVELVSSGGGAGQVILRNGTSASSTAYAQVDGASASTSIVINYAGGKFFPSGCFVDIVGSNVDYVTIVYSTEV